LSEQCDTACIANKVGDFHVESVTENINEMLACMLIILNNTNYLHGERSEVEVVCCSRWQAKNLLRYSVVEWAMW
jgi:hypothetical protein